MNSSNPCYVGIDVSKATLDVAVYPSGEHFSLPNTDKGIAQVLDTLRGLSPKLVAMEATGGLELPLTWALAAAAIPVGVFNPRQVRGFAKALGHLAKTDKIDAQLLARFAEVVREQPRTLPDPERDELSALLARRRQVLEMLVAEKNRLSTARHTTRGHIQSHIEWLKHQLRLILWYGPLRWFRMAHPR